MKLSSVIETLQNVLEIKGNICTGLTIEHEDSGNNQPPSGVWIMPVEYKPKYGRYSHRYRGEKYDEEILILNGERSGDETKRIINKEHLKPQVSDSKPSSSSTIEKNNNDGFGLDDSKYSEDLNFSEYDFTDEDN